MRIAPAWYTITEGNLDEENNKLRFKHNVGTWYDGTIASDKSVSGTHSGLLPLSLSYIPPSHR